MPQQPELPLKRCGKPLARLPEPKEFKLQIALVRTLFVLSRPGWYFFHPANGEARDATVGAKLKAMGVRPGVPDLVLISPDGVAHWLELKRKGERIKPGSYQDIFRAMAQGHGWPYAVADNLDDALAVLDSWGAIRGALA